MPGCFFADSSKHPRKVSRLDATTARMSSSERSGPRALDAGAGVSLAGAEAAAVAASVVGALGSALAFGEVSEAALEFAGADDAAGGWLCMHEMSAPPSKTRSEQTRSGRRRVSMTSTLSWRRR